MTDFKQPATRLRCLQIASTDLEMLLPERGAQVAGLREQRVADPDAIEISLICTGE